MFVILNSDEVRAVLNGSKTGHQIPIIYRGHWSVDEREDGILWPLDCTWTHGEDGEPWLRCPYAPGSRVWVRETWQVATGCHAGDLGAAVRYRDTEIKACWMPSEKPLPLGLTWDRWRSPVTMPRWASRIDLETTAVRVIRVDGVWTWDCDWRRV